MEHVLLTDKLSKQYHGTKALSQVSMQIEQGAIYGLIGKNGVGKTTLIRILCGLQTPTSGTYSLYGIPYHSNEIARSRRRMGAIVETPSLYLELSAEDNLRYQFQVIGKPATNDIFALLELVGLQSTGKKPVKQFSLGMRQRLGIAIALAGDPDFLILDEPNNGLDPQGIIEIRELLLKLNREHRITILISSHMLDELAKVATHYGFLDQGTLVSQISAEQFKQNTRTYMQVEVNDTKILARVLDQMQISYTILSDEAANLFGDWNVTALTLELAKANGVINRITKHDESLESYYMKLVGGQIHE